MIFKKDYNLYCILKAIDYNILNIYIYIYHNKHIKAINYHNK